MLPSAIHTLPQARSWTYYPGRAKPACIIAFGEGQESYHSIYYLKKQDDDKRVHIFLYYPDQSLLSIKKYVDSFRRRFVSSIDKKVAISIFIINSKYLLHTGNSVEEANSFRISLLGALPPNNDSCSWVLALCAFSYCSVCAFSLAVYVRSRTALIPSRPRIRLTNLTGSIT